MSSKQAWDCWVLRFRKECNKSSIFLLYCKQLGPLEHALTGFFFVIVDGGKNDVKKNDFSAYFLGLNCFFIKFFFANLRVTNLHMDYCWAVLMVNVFFGIVYL